MSTKLKYAKFLSNINAIALFTVTFSHLHYNVFEHGCEAISGNFALLARNCLTSTFKNIVMQMRKVNCEKCYCYLRVVKGFFVIRERCFLFPVNCEMANFFLVKRDLVTEP